LEFNYRWLTEFLLIDPEEICFTEDLWAGGGNMGPCMEYFVGGMELGNMVFMQYKYFHDGSFEELKIKVIDTGIGLERIAWFLNGDFSSYFVTFKKAFEFLKEKIKIEVDENIWRKIGPYLTRLDVDECENLEKTWQQISEIIQMPKEEIQKAMEPLKDVFVILDHTRTV
jgi:alanyl-tRNA synthetase